MPRVLFSEQLERRADYRGAQQIAGDGRVIKRASTGADK
jgi:hypothetical protein